MKRTRYPAIIAGLMLLAFLAGRQFPHAVASKHQVLYYVDPMHPAYKSDKPGIAPDCGMQLEPVYSDSNGTPSPDEHPQSGLISISAETQKLIGVRTAVVERSNGPQTERLLGRVLADERRIYRVASSTDGWIREISPVSIGEVVRKGQLLASFYGQEFLGAQRAYIFALNSLDRWQATANQTQDQLNLLNAQIQQAADGLTALGMSEAQLEELKQKRQLSQMIRLYAPTEGFITARNIYANQRFERGTEFFKIADFRHVWIMADVLESDLQYFQPGTVAEVHLPQQQRTFHAVVSNVLAQFDSASRTLKLRLEAENPGFVLRPDMFVELKLPTRLMTGLTIPIDAVVNSGTSERVFVERGEGKFEPREVKTGWHFGDRIQIVSGLMENERVVASGTFMVDSESRLKSVTASANKASITDPVCGMDLAQETARASGTYSVHDGETFYFCSESCKRTFEKTPQKYSASRHRGQVAEVQDASDREHAR